MKKIDKYIDLLLSVSSTICYFCLIIVVLMQIAARYMPSLTLSWTEELSRFFFVFIISFGAPLSYKYKSYADVDLIYDKFNEKTKNVMDITGNICVFIFTVVVLISGWRFMLIGKRSVSPALQWPMYIHHSTIILFAIGTIFYSVFNFIKTFTKSEKSEDVKEVK
ncbi:TRAP transporter small permease [Peptoniphilus indolicus]|uniref:TRAP-type transport system permease small protein n=2 Tax=Peptoniphilus indolicus TaxID=33030 RepID=G4D333_9FIRM|nr:TRAP transporter small permease [Peptoniphilus indolicus]EGY80064.1 TRAP-type transport system permease small protein [Peptoniphilus indolicus ATCC 29427]SUB75108.1 TRAP-type C4-dicarboxylate transport system, small permease component [Peptoniphilus indolicus]